MSICPWNIKYLDPPPLLTYTTPNVDGSDLKSINGCLGEAKKVLKRNDQLIAEVKLLQKLRYIRWSTLRRHKQMQAIHMALKSLRSLMEMDMPQVYGKFSASIPKIEFTKQKDVILPSKQALEFVLVRTVGLMNVLHQICEYCYLAIEYTHDRLNATHFLTFNIIVAACLSRIWIICATLATKTAEWYKNLYPWLNVLCSSPAEWLSSEQALPFSLENMLESGSVKLVQQAVKSQTFTGKCKKDPIKSLKRLLDLSTLDDADTINNNHVKIASRVDAEEINVLSAVNFDSKEEEELGEIVSRENYQKSIDVEQEMLESCSIEVVMDSVTTKKQFFAWLRQETILRKSQSHKLSLRIKNSQWTYLRRLLRSTKGSKCLEEQKKIIIDWCLRPKEKLKQLKKSKKLKMKASLLVDKKIKIRSSTATKKKVKNNNSSSVDLLIDSSSSSTTKQKNKSKKRRLISVTNSEPVNKRPIKRKKKINT